VHFFADSLKRPTIDQYDRKAVFGRIGYPFLGKHFNEGLRRWTRTDFCAISTDLVSIEQGIAFFFRHIVHVFHELHATRNRCLVGKIRVNRQWVVEHDPVTFSCNH
jgi:hypothetical protein